MRARSLVTHLEMSPMIDTMASLTVMLFAMTVWWSAAGLTVEQSICDGGGGCALFPEPAPPPLTLHFTDAHVWFGRKMESGTVVPRREEAVDLALLDAMLVFDRFLYPGERMVILNVDDGVAYGDMLPTMDRARRYGYDKTLLAGGPASIGG